MRARLLIVLPILALVIGAVAFASGLFTTASHTRTDRSGVITVDVQHLPVGGIKTKLAAIPGPQLTYRPVYIVRDADDHYLALFSRSPHLGCRIVTAEDPNYEGLADLPQGVFEDPCDGAYFTLSGQKLNGPSPRGLDRFPISAADGRVRIDLNTLIPGPPPPA